MKSDDRASGAIEAIERRLRMYESRLQRQEMATASVLAVLSQAFDMLFILFGSRLVGSTNSQGETLEITEEEWGGLLEMAQETSQTLHESLGSYLEAMPEIASALHAAGGAHARGESISAMVWQSYMQGAQTLKNARGEK